MATRKIQYLAGSLEPEIEARTGPEESVAATARTMAERYASLMLASLPPLHLDEWKLLAAVLVEIDDVPEFWPLAVRRSITSGEALRACPVADVPGFVARLDALTPAGAMAVADLIERWALDNASLPGAE